jgi:hypothetical protein
MHVQDVNGVTDIILELDTRLEKIVQLLRKYSGSKRKIL